LFGKLFFCVQGRFDALFNAFGRCGALHGTELDHRRFGAHPAVSGRTGGWLQASGLWAADQVTFTYPGAKMAALEGVTFGWRWNRVRCRRSPRIG
jgi:hypothetical protein